MTRGWVSPVQLYEMLATQMGLDSIDFEKKPPQPVYAKLIPESVARRLSALPVGDHGHQLVVAMVDPVDMRAIDDLKAITGRSIRPMLAEPDQLQRAINSVWVQGHDEPENLAELTSETPEPEPREIPQWQLEEDEADDFLVNVNDAPVVEFVEEVLQRAVAERASDVHLEATDDDMRVRFRVDGVLRDVARPAKSIHAGVVSRVKVLAEMDITNRRTPQDGRLNVVTPDDRDVGMRVVTVPTVHGEAVVIRILDSGSELPAIDDVGLLPRGRYDFERAFHSPSGGILVTGPTGSGKTTTLYATLNELNDPGTSIVTVEDPVEYRLDGIKQIQINNKAGMNFASALRSILRADPDIVLVGEIRDTETAKLAAEASLTGHLVLSTLHTNSAAATPIRLLEMGVEPFLVTAGVTCVMAQRLSRRLCVCKERYEPGEEALINAGWPESWSLEGREFARPVGCKECGGTGYRGRFGIHEVMPIGDEISKLILARASTVDVQHAAIAGGMLTLRQDGLFKAGRGDTSLEELTRVTPA